MTATGKRHLQGVARRLAIGKLSRFHLVLEMAELSAYYRRPELTVWIAKHTIPFLMDFECIEWILKSMLLNK